jgi:ABC-type branched-subunit amino acid transport system substrate-binding protein
MTRAALAAFLVLAGCTATPPRGSEQTQPEAGPTGTPTEAPRPDLGVIADPGSPEVDGARLAADQAGVVARFVDPEGDPEEALREAIALRPPAVVIVRAPGAVVRARAEIEAGAVPVIEVGSDLYSDRLLFRYAFQVSTPLTWQARVLAHYLVADRGYDRIGIIGDPAVARAALDEEGVPATDRGDVEAYLALGGPPGGLSGPQLAGPADTLSFADFAPAGTVACAPYTWAGWAEPIPRVARFRARFETRFGREPGLAEQEGYEAVRAVAEALHRTGGRGGDALVRALESFRDETFSSTPIRLGPDDHVFAEQSHLGLFAREPGGVRAPGEDLEPVPWRPVMRTFTTNGKRVNLTDRDVRVFFPSWRPPAPRPNYWQSRYGIVTRPDDPLH